MQQFWCYCVTNVLNAVQKLRALIASKGGRSIVWQRCCCVPSSTSWSRWLACDCGLKNWGRAGGLLHFNVWALFSGIFLFTEKQSHSFYLKQQWQQSIVLKFLAQVAFLYWMSRFCTFQKVCTSKWIKTGHDCKDSSAVYLWSETVPWFLCPIAFSGI